MIRIRSHIFVLHLSFPSLPFPSPFFFFFWKHTQTRRGNHLYEPICIRVTECSSDGSIEFVSKYPPWIGNGLIGPVAQRGSVGRLDWNHSTWSCFHRKGNLFSYGMIFCDPTPLLVTFLSLLAKRLRSTPLLIEETQQELPSWEVNLLPLHNLAPLISVLSLLGKASLISFLFVKVYHEAHYLTLKWFCFQILLLVSLSGKEKET